jgi:hypothetical protein
MLDVILCSEDKDVRVHSVVLDLASVCGETHVDGRWKRDNKIVVRDISHGTLS